MTRRDPGRIGAVLAVLATVATAPAAADPAGDAGQAARPIGAIDLTSELLLTGGTPRQRVGVAVTAYLTRRLGLRAAAHLIQRDPFAESGLATLGVAYRAAAARPRLELVVRAEAGLTWPAAPALGAGSTTYVWPTRWPVALAFDVGAVAILDGVADSRLAISLGLGVALAR